MPSRSLYILCVYLFPPCVISLAKASSEIESLKEQLRKRVEAEEFKRAHEIQEKIRGLEPVLISNIEHCVRDSQAVVKPADTAFEMLPTYVSSTDTRPQYQTFQSMMRQGKFKDSACVEDLCQKLLLFLCAGRCFRASLSLFALRRKVCRLWTAAAASTFLGNSKSATRLSSRKLMLLECSSYVRAFESGGV